MKRIAIPLSLGCAPNYRAAVEACGGQLLEVLPGSEDELVARADALLLPGGEDLDPALYGEPNLACRGVDSALDALQLRSLDAAVSRRRSVFGICRGLQLINVYFGGSLLQDIPHGEGHRPLGEGVDNVHSTTVDPSSFLFRAYGRERLSVNSAHHQAVKVLGRGLRVVQRSEDGLAEALCHTELPIRAVQWHPERMCLARARSDTVDGLLLFQRLMASI